MILVHKEEQKLSDKPLRQGGFAKGKIHLDEG